MKCDFCLWNESPSSVPAIVRHLNADHYDLENYQVVWREGELVIADAVEESDVEISIVTPKHEDVEQVIIQSAVGYDEPVEDAAQVAMAEAVVEEESV